MSTNSLSENPRKLFLLDGIGALVSAFSLGVVLVQLEAFFGIPRNTLYFLAFLPCLFAAYDFYCYWRIKENWRVYLKAIAIVNLLYCVISLALAFYHIEHITFLGWGYIIIEILIVVVLANIELKVATSKKT